MQSNVLLLFPHFNSMQQASSLRSPQIAIALQKNGHNVTVFAPGVDQRTLEPYPEMAGKLYAKYDIEGVRLIRTRTLSNFRKNPIRRLAYDVVFAVLTFVRALFLQRIDVVVAAYPPNVMPLFAYLLSRIRGVPLVFEVRDLVADALQESNYVKSSLFVRFAQFMEKFIVSKSAHIITVSNGIKDILVEKAADPSKFTIVPIGYAPEVFDTADYSFDPRNEFGWGDKFVAIYTGALTPAYDIPTLLRCAKRLKANTNILIAIVGGGELREEYMDYCKENGLDNCQFIDYQPRQRLPAILAGANVGVHLFRDNPLWSYVLGNKTFDYLASGLPMIYAGTGDTAILIETAEAGCSVTPEDDEALAQALLKFEYNREETKQAGERGRAHVLAHYNAWSLQDDFDKALRMVMNNDPKSTSKVYSS